MYSRPGYLDSIARRLASSLGLPLAVEFNGPVAHEGRLKGRPLPLLRLGERFEQRNLEEAAAIFVVSKELKEYLGERGIDENRVTVLPNGVDHELFDKDRDYSETRRRIGIDSSTFVVGFSGSFQVWHGAELLVEAFRRLIPRIAPRRACLLLIGGGERAEELERLGRHEGVRLVGRVPHDKMPEMIAVCDVCVAPFLANTFFYFSPLKMFEYMAMGKPIVASRLGQIVELLQDGRAGVLVPPGDIEALVNALVQLEADTKLRADLSEAAYRASLKHTWKANVSAVVETMDHVRGRSAKTTGRWIRGR